MAIEKWQQLSSRKVFTHPRLQLSEDRVRLPDGREVDYLRVSPNEQPSVAIIAISGLNQMLVQREYSYPPNEILWQLPGGTVLDGESAEEAANRELSEESGFIGGVCEVIGYYYANNRLTDQRQYVVVCTQLTTQSAEPDPEEFIETTWMPLEEVRAMLAKGEFRNVYMLAALNMYFAQTSGVVPPQEV